MSTDENYSKKRLCSERTFHYAQKILDLIPSVYFVLKKINMKRQKRLVFLLLGFYLLRICIYLFKFKFIRKLTFIFNLV